MNCSTLHCITLYVIFVETGQYALQIEVHIRMIKYWLKLTLSHSHQYINKLFCKGSEWLSLCSTDIMSKWICICVAIERYMY